MTPATPIPSGPIRADRIPAGDLMRRLQARRWARKDLLAFLDFVWWKGSLEPFKVGRHTRVIASKLTEGVHRLRNGESSFLDIRVPVRHGKSDLVSRALPAFVHGVLGDCGLDPEVIIASYQGRLSEGFSRDAQDIIQSKPFRELWPAVKISPRAGGVQEWQIAGRRGKTNAIGLEGGITGRGGHVIILDDYFQGREDAESETWRDKSWNAFRNDLMSRRSPTGAFVVVCATPWHVDGIQQRIQKAMRDDPSFPRFDVIQFKARWRDKDGDPWQYLFPERIPAEWYDSQYGTLTPYEASGLLDCEPIPAAGNVSNSGWFEVVDYCPVLLRKARWWDTAATKKKSSDQTVGAKAGVAANGITYITDIKRGRWPGPEVPQQVASAAAADSRDTEVWMEYEGGSQGQIAASLFMRLLAGYTVYAAPAVGRGVKLVKVMPGLSRGRAGLVKLVRGPWVDEFRASLDVFPEGDHDDDVDAAMQAVAALNGDISAAKTIMSNATSGYVV